MNISLGANNVIILFEIHANATYTWAKTITKKQRQNFIKQLTEIKKKLNDVLTNEQKQKINNMIGEDMLTVEK